MPPLQARRGGTCRRHQKGQGPVSGVSDGTQLASSTAVMMASRSFVYHVHATSCSMPASYSLTCSAQPLTLQCLQSH
jgi:hypothetical protein